MDDQTTILPERKLFKSKNKAYANVRSSMASRPNAMPPLRQKYPIKTVNNMWEIGFESLQPAVNVSENTIRDCANTKRTKTKHTVSAVAMNTNIPADRYHLCLTYL